MKAKGQDLTREVSRGHSGRASSEGTGDINIIGGGWGGGWMSVCLTAQGQR